jgi:uncharacterized protein YfaS (alpha-2-macroglobulin family)
MVDPTPFPAQHDFVFGKADESFDERMFTLPDTTTDGAGHADLLVALSDVPHTSLPLRARVVASVADPGGRCGWFVERGRPLYSLLFYPTR